MAKVVPPSHAAEFAAVYLASMARRDPHASPTAKRRLARSVGHERARPLAYEAGRTLFLDDPGLMSETDIGAADLHGRTVQFSLASDVDAAADEHEDQESGDGTGLIIAGALRDLAARIRAEGVDTAVQWLAKHPLP